MSFSSFFVSFNLQVGLAVQMLTLMSNSGKDSSFVVKLDLLMEWHHPTISFNNLKWDKRSNIADQSKVWSPVIRFSNQKEDGIPLQTELYAVRQKSGDLNSNEELVMREIFKGEENPFQKREVYQLDLNCAFANLSRFPFDTETCVIEMFLLGNQCELVPKPPFKFEPRIQTLGDLLLEDYWLKLYTSGANDSSGISIQLSFVRDLHSIFFLKYFPIFLMNVINHVSNYLGNMKNINGIVGLNISTTVAIILLFISNSKELPMTIKMKSFDQWVLACLSYPCLVIVLNIVLHYVRLKELQSQSLADEITKEEEEGERVQLCNGTNNPAAGISSLKTDDPPDHPSEEDESANQVSKDNSFKVESFTDILECTLLYLLPIVYIISNTIYIVNGFLM